MWATLGLGAVTLLPGLSLLPPWCGVALGLGCLGLQVATGADLLRSLLLLRSDAPPEGLDPPGRWWLDEERPFVVALGGREIVATRGLLRDLPGDVPSLAAELREAAGGLGGEVLARALALPCLLRAFHSATCEYGRLRGGGGPLRLLGEACLLLARALEAPALALGSRFGRTVPPEGRAGLERSLALARLADRLARVGGMTARDDPGDAVPRGFPPWMEALGPLAPLSVPEVRALAREAAARGGPPADPAAWGDPAGPGPLLPVPGSPHPPLALRRALLEGRPPPPGEPRRAALRRALPGLGLGAGLGLALLPGGFLALPVLLLAAGLALRAVLEMPLSAPMAGTVRDLVAAAPGDGRGRPVRLSGRLGGPPPDLAAPPGLYLHDTSGAVLLEGLPGAPEGDAVVTGWLRLGPPAMRVGEVHGPAGRRRLYPYLRRLLVPLELGAVGAAWLVLQMVGL